MDHLDSLEAESIYVLREAYAKFDKLAILWSLGKDSNVVLWLTKKAFFGHVPLPVLHVDTGKKFKAMYDFRARYSEAWGLKLLVEPCPPIDQMDPSLPPAARSAARKTAGLNAALARHGFAGLIAGIRRDEEGTRAKERYFSPRTKDNRWDLKDQPPEFWNQYMTSFPPGTHVRIHPLLHWSEIDVWRYVAREEIPVVPLYFAAPRPVVERDGMLIMVDDGRLPLREGERPRTEVVRFRTLGCYPLTGAIASAAKTLPDIIAELVAAKVSERQGRLIDHDQAGSMEKKKQEGYF